MFRKKIVFVVFLALAAVNTAFSQVVAIDTALSNAAKDISESVSQGTRIAVLNISSDFMNLSDYIINELIVNLVNLRNFQIVPRSTVELEAANMEFDFQMTGNVSDDSQKRLGQFFGAGTIITGTVTRDSANSFRLVINTIDLESFTFQSSFRASFQNDRQVKTLIADSGGVFYEDYTVGQRIGMGALNIFGGAGSIYNGHKIGWVTTGMQAAGILTILAGLIFLNPAEPDINNRDFWHYDMDKPPPRELELDVYRYNRARSSYEEDLKTRNALIVTGSAVIGVGVVFGFIIPFFHHKPDNTNISQNNFPFSFELVSTNNQEINGARLLYNVKF